MPRGDKMFLINSIPCNQVEGGIPRILHLAKEFGKLKSNSIPLGRSSTVDTRKDQKVTCPVIIELQLIAIY
jgi:hypothetical protein